MTSLNRLLPAAVGSLLAMVLASSCTADAPMHPVESSTRWGPDLTDDEALARIPMNGSDDMPLAWDVPSPENQDTAGALLAARRFRALDYFTNSQPTEVDGYLYQWVATERMIGVRYPDGPPGPEVPGFPPARGPVWLWVVEVERTSPNGVVVHMCEDHGWRGAADGSDELPSANRAFLWHFEVVEQEALDGETRWLVNRVWADRDLLGPDVRHECEEWAVHDPEKDG